MRAPRFFLSGADLSALRRLTETEAKPGLQIKLAEDDLIKQLRSVLRLGQGHKIVLLDGLGSSYEFEIERVEKSAVYCQLRNVLPHSGQNNLSIIVGLALIKADRFEWCIEKLTELGVSKIQPLSTRHCVIKLNSSSDAKGDAKQELKLKRWQSIVKEAAEQCERETIPPVVRTQDLFEFIKQHDSADMSDLRFICCERINSAPLVKALHESISKRDPLDAPSINSISLLVGPEGGFSPEEIQAAQEQAWQPVTLGPRILRSETAAIAAMSQVASVLDI